MKFNLTSVTDRLERVLTEEAPKEERVVQLDSMLRALRSVNRESLPPDQKALLPILINKVNRIGQILRSIE